MKRRFAIGFFVCILLGFVFFGESSSVTADETDSVFLWEESKDGTITITDIEEIESITYLEIPEEIDGKRVTGLKFQLLFDAGMLREIRLPSGVRNVFGQMFSLCESLENIYVSEDNEYYVSIDGMLYTKMQDELKLEKVPVKKIGTYFEIPQEATYLDAFAIYNCHSIETIFMHEGVKLLGSTLSDSDGVTYYYEASNCFSCCPNLKEIIVDEKNTDYVSADGVLYTKDKKILISCPPAYEETEYVIPEGVEEICWEAFRNCQRLKSVTVPLSLREIKRRAFVECIELETIFLKEGLREMEPYAFESCRNLKGIALPTSIESIGRDVFLNCDKIEITNADSHRSSLLQAIKDGTAWEATALEEVIQEPQKVSLLKELTQKGEAGIFTYGVTEEEEVVITGLTETAEKDKRNRKLVIPEYLDGKPVVGISEGAFAFVPVTSVELPEGLSEIGAGAFYGCNLVKEVHLPSTVTYLGARVFAANYLLQAIYVEEGNAVYTSQNGVLFDKSIRILVQMPAAYPAAKYSIPDTVSVIGEYAFGNNRNILHLDIPDSVVKIREKAFWNMKELRELRIPSEIDLTSDVYAHCPNLKSVWYEKK